jgi:transglutaminase/protease-like cytokinesis protein 3
LTQPFSEDIVKARAIFIWITDNIRYDYKFYNKGKEVQPPQCKSGMNCEQLLIDWENKYLRKIIKKRKAICDGYARLFKKMCGIAGIRSEIISGYTKTKPYQIGMTGTIDHGWNAIWLDSNYYLLDPTWAAGVCPEDEETGKLVGFQKKFNNYY